MNKQVSSAFTWLVAIFSVFALSGCENVALFNSKGPVGEAEMWTIIIAWALMLIIIIPVFAMIFWFAWHYRASNKKAAYEPKWDFSLKIELATWIVPLLVVLGLSGLAFYKTFKLDPFKPLAEAEEHLNIHVVSLDWKWLFIYPEQNIASVNKMVIPVNVPLRFDITSDTVMTSFFVPQLGSQIYAMPRHRSVLHLIATETGEMRGQNNNLSGLGYSHMHFPVHSVTQEEFDAWVDEARQSPRILDIPRFEALSKPSMGHPQMLFSAVDGLMFEYVIEQFEGGHAHEGVGFGHNEEEH